MPALRELQAGVRTAILAGDERTAAAAVRPDGLGAAARLAVYRHHVFASLTAALESIYPVIARLVDPRFFRYAADRYIRAQPPASPCLFEYGASFPDFLAAFPASRRLAYLPGVARLEWAMNVALHSPDTPPVEPETLRALPVLALHPSLTLLVSPWPIDAIWRANQPGAVETAVDLHAGAVRLQIWRADDEVVFRGLSPGEFAFRDALACSGRLDAGAEAALAADPDADLVALVRRLLDERVLVGPGARPGW
ncbi:MAG TPA: DNA-binding domain-containing protein [Methylomirabilota bacterium]|nr:DNA-binding domain-containing protein [Methylomirabilota bacterium]